MRNRLKAARTVPVALALAVVAMPAQARRDSVTATYDTHRVKAIEFAIPAATVGAAALFAGGGWLGGLRKDAQCAFAGDGQRKTKVDDYLQYSPMVATYALDLCGIDAAHNFKDRTIILAMAYATMGIAVNGIKLAASERRPDSPARNSFPSGHTATAFMGAELMRREFKGSSPVAAYSGYAVATAVGVLRICNNRHWVNDVVAGAAIGIASTKLAYWLYPRIFTKHKGQHGPAVAALPSCQDGGCALTACITF